MKKYAALKALLISCLFSSCLPNDTRSLPYLGKTEIQNNDTVYTKIGDFVCTDQDGKVITNSTFSNQVYVADFFFLSCPTICPKMTNAMKQVYQHYKEEPKVAFISYTIDPEHDSVDRLKSYAKSLGVNSQKWHFVTCDKDDVIKLSKESYYLNVFDDSLSPGGIAHSGALVLVDNNRHIRGVYNVFVDNEVGRLKNDIAVLLKENKN